MKLRPVFTEKSMGAAKEGFYTFRVDPSMNKYQIKSAIEKTFGVHVTSVHTVNFKKSLKRNLRGRTVAEKAKKKAIVTLKGEEKIDLFEEKKGK